MLNALGYEPGVTLEATLRDLLPPGCAIALGPIGDAPASPFAQEEQMIVRAVGKRRREFRAGRRAARQALAQLGCPPCPIPACDGGDPMWPPAYVGSIAHTDDIVAAAVAAVSALGGLGVDLEPDTALDDDLTSLICRPEELADRLDLGCDPAKLRFVAKEAYFKAVFPTQRVLFDFQDVRVHFDPARGRLKFELPDPVKDGTAPASGEVVGRYALDAGHIVAVAWFVAHTLETVVR